MQVKQSRRFCRYCGFFSTCTLKDQKDCLNGWCLSASMLCCCVCLVESKLSPIHTHQHNASIDAAIKPKEKGSLRSHKKDSLRSYQNLLLLIKYFLISLSIIRFLIGRRPFLFFEEYFFYFIMALMYYWCTMTVKPSHLRNCGSQTCR